MSIEDLVMGIRQLNLVHFETRSSAGNMSATIPKEQDAPTTFKTMVFKIDVV